MQVAYALDSMHLAKVLLLKLWGIEATSDDGPRIAQAKDADLSDAFVPSVASCWTRKLRSGVERRSGAEEAACTGGEVQSLRADMGDEYPISAGREGESGESERRQAR